MRMLSASSMFVRSYVCKGVFDLVLIWFIEDIYKKKCFVFFVYVELFSF